MTDPTCVETEPVSIPSLRHSERLHAAGIVLPQPTGPVGNFINARLNGNLLFLSGQGPTDSSGRLRTGKVGDSVSVEQAHDDARLAGLALLANIQQALGSLDRVANVIKLFGMVNATPNFTDHPKVIDGCSNLFVEVFGEAGRHARSAVGHGSLPSGITVEIEAIVSVVT